MTSRRPGPSHLRGRPPRGGPGSRETGPSRFSEMWSECLGFHEFACVTVSGFQGSPRLRDRPRRERLCYAPGRAASMESFGSREISFYPLCYLNIMPGKPLIKSLWTSSINSCPGKTASNMRLSPESIADRPPERRRRSGEPGSSETNESRPRHRSGFRIYRQALLDPEPQQASLHGSAVRNQHRRTDCTSCALPFQNPAYSRHPGRDDEIDGPSMGRGDGYFQMPTRRRWAARRAR